MGKSKKEPATPSDVMVAFGLRLKQLCDEAWPGEKQKDVGKRFNVSQSMMGRYYRGAAYPANSQMALMAIKLGVYKEYLETGRGEKWIEPPASREIVDMTDFPSDLKNAIRSVLAVGRQPNA